jgi:ABC-type transport system involved in multi-copper enzyme maturation permease subunit
MTRFAWLQSRTQVIVAAVGLLAIAAISLFTGPGVVHLYNTVIAPCAANDDCSGTTINLFLRHHRDLQIWLGILVIVIPGILGVFWGAPLVAREYESGTYRLAWTQSVPRTRWLSIKIGLVLLITMAVVGLLSFAVSWWATPFDRVNGSAFDRFDQRDIVPIAYAAFAVAVGVTAGVFIRRTLPAMATACFVFVAIRIAFTQFVRPSLFTPKTLTAALDPDATGFGRTGSGPAVLEPDPHGIPNAWIQSVRIVDKAGHGLTGDFLANACPQMSVEPRVATTGNRTQVPIGVHDALHDCVTKVAATYHQVASYQPASRYWAFQWVEFGIYIAAAIVLTGICVWSVRRRRS